MKKTLLALVLIGALVLGGIYLYSQRSTVGSIASTAVEQTTGAVVSEVLKAHPLSIARMRAGSYPGSAFTLVRQLPEKARYTQTVVSYESEGNTIYALLTLPKGEKPPAGWPVVVFNHGYIPPEQYRTTERYEAYVDAFARAGFIVLKSDYRGHGDSEGEPEGAYYSPAYTIDVLNAVASIKQHPDADPRRIGMWGHSMGGNITMRSMVITKDIKAGVIWGGVVGTYEEMMTNWRRSRPWTPSQREQQTNRPSRQRFIEEYGEPTTESPFWKSISAHTYAADMSGPIQLHHAVNDETVPVQFSRSFARRLQEEGKPVSLYEYQTGGHNISGTAFSQAMQRSVAFFQDNL